MCFQTDVPDRTCNNIQGSVRHMYVNEALRFPTPMNACWGGMHRDGEDGLRCANANDSMG